jgi:transposase
MATSSEPAGKPAPNLSPKIKAIDRKQSAWVPVDVETLVGRNHKIRAIWELTERFDLSELRQRIKSKEGEAGQAAEDPRLLISIWIYAYSEGVSSSRDVAERMDREAALMWLAGLRKISHATLSNFRKDHQEVLNGIFIKLLGVLETAGVVKLDQVMHDGTKIRAQAGVDTFRREPTLRENLEKARVVVGQMANPDAKSSAREAAAKRRAARERVERLEAALTELKQEQAKEEDEKKRKALRVSMTEPEARKMKHGDQAITPAYNAQISTDAEKQVIVGHHLSQCSSDSNSLEPAMDVVKENLGRDAKQAVADGGYTNRGNIIKMEQRGIDFIGSLRDRQEAQAAAVKASNIEAGFAPQFFIFQAETNRLECPAGKPLAYVRQSVKRGNLYHQYRASGSDCEACEYRAQCCPKHAAKGRTVSRLMREPEAIAKFREKMATEAAKQAYRKRGAVAEFPNAWIKEKIGLRKFSLRGMVKAGIELTWACLSYNVMVWMRECWRKPAVAAAA